jgi:Papain family cysteine protease
MPEAVNPYIAGSPITGSEMFFGREDVFEFVKRTLSGKHRDNVIVLYGQRRTGKTSVLYHISRHLDPGYLCVFVDLHALALNGVGGLLWELANYIVRGLRRDYGVEVPRPSQSEFMADARDYFRNEFLGSVKGAIGDRHILLMLDEVGRLHEKIQAGELEGNVFEYLRHLMQHYEWLDFLYSLGSSLEEMQQEYSLLFSVALYRQISFLGREAATALITKPVQDQYKIEPAAVDKVLEIASGHPYYTQLICHCLFSRWQQKPTDTMRVKDVDEVLDLAIELGSANLKFVWAQSNPGEKAVMAGLATCPAKHARIRDMQSAWSALDVTLPQAEIARAVRSLVARDIVAGDDHYRFTVDLQRLWLRQQRRLDWVKEEISSVLPEWRGAVAEERTGPPHVEDSLLARWRHLKPTRKVMLLLAVAILVIAAGLFGWHERNVHRAKASQGHAASSTNATNAAQTDQGTDESDSSDLGETTSHTVPYLARLYNFPTEFDGSGQTIGVLEFGGGYKESDLTTYFSDLAIPKPKVTWVSLDGARNTPSGASGADGQVDLDIEIAGAAAPGAQIVVYFAPMTLQGWLDVLNGVAKDDVHHPSVLMIGWGMPEGQELWSPQSMQAVNDALHTVATKGITICVAAGDTGVTNGLADGQAHVDFPASSPWVLAVGGTTMIALGHTIGSENVWNDGESGGATGGGFSGLFPMPDWQAHANVPGGAGHSGRGLPDVAANADPASGYQIRVDGVQQVIGGTGAAAALWGGFIATINQGLGRNAGYFNPALYTTLGPAGVFRSITRGDNGRDSVKGYAAGPGWNASTGWGAPNGRKLLSAMRALFGMPATLDYSSMMLPVRDVGNEGSVVGFALAAAMEYQIKKTQQKDVRLSPRYLYYEARLKEGTASQDSGAQLKDALQTVLTKGAIPDSAWPYVPGQFASKPPDLKGVAFYKIKSARHLDSLQQVIAALQSSGPVVAGITMYEANMSAEVQKNGVLPMPSKSDQVLGSTAICIVGYDDDRKLLKFINSWGAGWGDHGYGYLPFTYLEQHLEDAWAISM